MNADARDVRRRLELLQSLCQAGDRREAVAESDRLLAPETELSRRERAYVLMLKASALDDRRAARDCVVAAREQLGDPEDAEGQALLADAIHRQAQAARDTGESEEAVRLLDGLLERFGEDPPDGALETIADARVLRASAWHDLGNRDAALTEYDAIVDSYGDEEDAGVKSSVADALRAKAVALRLESKHVSEMHALTDLFNRLVDETDPALRRRAVVALCELGYAAETLQRPKQAAQFYKIVVDDYADDVDPETARLVAWAHDARDELM